MSPRQILFGRKFKTPLCKIGELVMTYDVTAKNKTRISRALYAFYIGPNDNGTGHQVFELLLKHIVTTPKCKHVPMPDNLTQVVNDMGKQEGMPNRIQFCNIHHKSTLADLFADHDLHNDNSCASDTDRGLYKKPEKVLKKITFDSHVDDNEVKDLNIDNEDILHLNDGGNLSCNII